MQKIVSQIPQLSSYLTKIPKQQHREAIKHLISLGLKTSRQYYCKENKYNEHNVLKNQINLIKEHIEDLNKMVRYPCHHRCNCCFSAYDNVPKEEYHSGPMVNDRPSPNEAAGYYGKTQNANRNIKFQKPVKDTIQHSQMERNENEFTVNPFVKRKAISFRHHLDDTGARQALNFPPSTLLEAHPKTKRKSQQYKKHIYQQQINKEQIGKIKEDKGQSLDKLKRDRTISDYSKATSKIKPLLDKDRIRFTQKQRDYQFKEGFNKYQYSDESQMEESSMNQSVSERQLQQRQTRQKIVQETTYNQPFQSSFKASNPASSSQKSNNKTSSKKSFERSKKQVSSKLEGSLEDDLHFEPKSKQSNRGEGQKYQHQNEESSGANRRLQQQDIEEDDVVSNSSSFSQFSINGSRKKEVGKISRKSIKD